MGSPALDSEEVWFDRLLRAKEAVAGWADRTREVEQVEPGSRIAKVDDEFPSAPLREGAWIGLLTATDHLGQMADLISPTMSMRPFAHLTLLRPALLGASQTVWLLCGTARERRSRALLVQLDERQQHRSFINSYRLDPFVQTHFSEGFRGNLDELWTKLTTSAKAAEREFHLGAPEKQSSKLVATKVITEAASYLTQRIDQAEEKMPLADTLLEGSSSSARREFLRLAFSYEWRLSSAAAHAKMWPYFVRDAINEEHQDRRVRKMTTSVQELATSIIIATLMTSEAWRLWDQLRLRQPTPADPQS